MVAKFNLNDEFSKLGDDLVAGLLQIADSNLDLAAAAELTTQSKATILMIASLLSRLGKPRTRLAPLQQSLQTCLYHEKGVSTGAFNLLSRYSASRITLLPTSD
jgi:hypothetical protein